MDKNFSSFGRELVEIFKFLIAHLFMGPPVCVTGSKGQRSKKHRLGMTFGVGNPNRRAISQDLRLHESDEEKVL
jgi:hypothetical protein